MRQILCPFQSVTLRGELLLPLNDIPKSRCVLFCFGAIAVDRQSCLVLAPFSNSFRLAFLSRAVLCPNCAIETFGDQLWAFCRWRYDGVAENLNASRCRLSCCVTAYPSGEHRLSLSFIRSMFNVVVLISGNGTSSAIFYCFAHNYICHLTYPGRKGLQSANKKSGV